jgi:hypothetical protein
LVLIYTGKVEQAQQGVKQQAGIGNKTNSKSNGGGINNNINR